MLEDFIDDFIDDTTDEARSDHRDQDAAPAQEQQSDDVAARAASRPTRKPRKPKKRDKRQRVKTWTPPDRSNAPATPEPDDVELWDRQKVCEFFGGSKPISLATLYRGKGTIYPEPINVGPNVVRWVGSECRDARQRMISGRDKPKPLLTRNAPDADASQCIVTR